MAKRYASFVLRWWRLGDGGERIEVEQITTGDHIVAPTIAQAVAWMTARIGAARATGETAPGEARKGGEKP
ncbi:MAG: hypothetical protein ACTHMP_22235 [Thermomicrobiales bacterium]